LKRGLNNLNALDKEFTAVRVSSSPFLLPSTEIPGSLQP